MKQSINNPRTAIFAWWTWMVCMVAVFLVTQEARSSLRHGRAFLQGKGDKAGLDSLLQEILSPHEGPECQRHSLLSQLSLSFTGQIFHMYLVHALRRIWKPSNKLWCAELLPEELSRCHPSDGRVSLHGKLCLSCLWFELFQIQTKLPQLFFKIVLKMQCLEASIQAKAYMGFLLWVEILRKSCPVYPKSTSASIPRLSLDSLGLVCLPQDWWWLFVFLRHRYVTQQIPVLGLSLPSRVFLCSGLLVRKCC